MGKINRAYFSPGDDCLNAILEALDNTRSSIKICVFTISDNRITKKLIQLHEKNKHMKIITDNEKLHDKGSDIKWLSESGIAVKVDKTRHHMHHKFALIDNKLLLTGSYNWTRSAEAYNHENLLITNNRNVCRQYQKEYDKLWDKMEDF